jgi:SAM-dependent methyltransferase
VDERELGEIKRRQSEAAHTASPVVDGLAQADLKATISVASAYDTGLSTGTADVVFCAAILHHLELDRAKAEILRILKPGGLLVLKEPIRFSPLMDRVRKLFPGQEDVSEYEHPITKGELSDFTRGFEITGDRCFRLPLVGLVQRTTKKFGRGRTWFSLDAWLLRTFPLLAHFATVRVMSMVPQPKSRDVKGDG